jgi:capsular polysaccharide biosynthesis protein
MNKIIQYFLKKFKVKYKVTVSFNKEYGDSDDKVYITKKILIKKNNHLKFVNENNVLIEYRSASGLNYIIENC